MQLGIQHGAVVPALLFTLASALPNIGNDICIFIYMLVFH